MLSPCQTSVLVSIIIPTLNEVENIDILFAAILAETDYGLDCEILVADGGSTDATCERVLEWAAVAPIQLIPGVGKGGLAGDVLNAASMARGDVIVVMDADLSHPPSRIKALVEPVLNGSTEMSVGSRYIPGGSTPDWSLRRRALSRLGGLLAWPLCDLKDPMSGFFAVRRERLLAVDPKAAGLKIGLEVIAHGGGSLEVQEVPIVFRDRIHGESKISFAQLFAYLRRLLVLAGGAVSASSASRFTMVGLAGIFVDLFTFQLLFALGATLITANVGSFCLASLFNYGLNSRWAFSASGEIRRRDLYEQYTRFFTVCLLALAIRGGVLAGMTTLFGIAPQVAILFAIGAAATISYLGYAFYVFPSVNPRVPYDLRWRVAAIGVVSYALVLRLLFLGLADLLPEEAYYWNYAQHLDIGYLDHPPMVAWLIRAGTTVFGNTEFGVRIGAYLGWCATAFFSFRLAHRLFGKSAAFVTLLLVTTLPFYFATGLIMTPDAPLTAAWAGALFFLERALLGNRSRAWWGVGVCIGVGMLSKYTIALLAAATLIFVLVDPRSRRWLAQPEPYLGAAVALLIFSPVIYWNMQHEWASFAFQTARRIEATSHFALPALIASVFLLLTPVGFLAATRIMSSRDVFRGMTALRVDEWRRHRFITIFTLVPVSAFVLFSLSHTIKINWTGPSWLAVMPAIAATIVAAVGRSSWVDLKIRKWWPPTLATTLLIYGLGLNYLVLGLPGLGYLTRVPSIPVAWQEFGHAASRIEHEVEEATGREPFLVGMDKYFVASQLAFYSADSEEGVANSVGRGVLGMASLMYGYWFTPEAVIGRPAVLFAFKRVDIEEPRLASQFEELGAPVEQIITKNGHFAGKFFYRVGYNFRGASPSAPGNGDPATDEDEADRRASSLVSSLP